MGTYGDKFIGKAVVTDPVQVQAFLVQSGGLYLNGAIFCEVPEMGLIGPENYVYCEYGLSLPYYRVNVDDEVIVETFINQEDEYERWFYTGLVDCGNTSIVPTTLDQMIIKTEAGKMTIDIGGLMFIIDSVAGTVQIGSATSTEAYVKGTAFLVELTKHALLMSTLQTAINGWTPVFNDGGTALKTSLAAFLALPQPSYSSILSTKIFGE